ncbi:hypothetical protein KL86DES1_10964 [uncultured Desulfovibrio sp.]|uniref:Uncharacterized protein n=1 Tax=uncultured Desulfovibrio sp. TaxID=167968 RepID=A0A212L113_9BACT|nr:hypothetical protein KL86DES1_10964 [uncultured Desulfovibrio sp.]VZH32836.1 conserved protein of unknown function [Desulfovibrio sp. 86]
MRAIPTPCLGLARPPLPLKKMSAGVARALVTCLSLFFALPVAIVSEGISIKELRFWRQFHTRRHVSRTSGGAGHGLRAGSKCAMETRFARVAELVDALDLESSTIGMGVQVPPLAPSRPPIKGAPRGI